MAMVNNEGTYRAKSITELVVGVTSKGGFPQAILQLNAEQMYDDETGEWVDVGDLDADVGTEIRAYLVLFGGNDKETLNSEQLRKVTGWDGSSFAALAEMDVSKTGILFRVKTNVYNGTESMQVSWIDEYDANPAGSTMKGLDAEGLRALDAKFRGQLKPKSITPAKAPVAAAPPVPSKRKRRTKAKPEVPAPKTGACTRDDAWAECEALRAKDVTDATLEEVWIAKVVEITGETPEDDITPEQWFAVKEAVLATDGMSTM